MTQRGAAEVARVGASPDPWGKPEGAPAWEGGPTANVHAGFTGHEHDPEHGLINMRGRIYDPELGRFTTADPFVQAPFDSQSLNRYAYVFNNPLRFTDPSGFVGDDAANPTFHAAGCVGTCTAIKEPERGVAKKSEQKQKTPKQGDSAPEGAAPVAAPTSDSKVRSPTTQDAHPNPAQKGPVSGTAKGPGAEPGGTSTGSTPYNVGPSQEGLRAAAGGDTDMASRGQGDGPQRGGGSSGSGVLAGGGPGDRPVTCGAGGPACGNADRWMAQNGALAGQFRDWLGRGSPALPGFSIADATNEIRREHATEFLQSTAGEVIYGPGAFLGDVESDIINIDYVLPRGTWKAAAFLHTHLDANRPELSGTDVSFARQTGTAVAAYSRQADILNVFVPNSRAGTIYQITNFRARSP